MYLLAAFNSDTVLKSLEYLWKGILAVAIVIFVIFLVVVILNALTAYFSKKKGEKADAGNASFKEKWDSFKQSLKDKQTARKAGKDEKNPSDEGDVTDTKQV